MRNKEQSYVTIPQFAKIIGVSRIAVFNMVKKGKIKAIRIGRNYAIDQRYGDEILGRSLSNTAKVAIEKAVKKTVAEYGEVLKKLGEQ